MTWLQAVGWLGLTGRSMVGFPLSLSVNTGPGASASRFPRQAGPVCRSLTGSGVAARSGAARANMAPCACVLGCVRVWTPEGCSGKGPKGLAATRTRRCGHVAGSPRTARPWRGHGEAGGTAGSRGTGAHARARVLASQSHGVAVPCARYRHPGPAARRNGGEATAAAGEDGGASGSCTRSGAEAGWGEGIP
jgi:hypothetical protein